MPLAVQSKGQPETIGGFTREDMIYFLHSNYLPNRISIAMAGNLQHDDIVAQVRDCFWRFFGHAERVVEPPGPFVPGIVSEENASVQAYFALGVPAPAYSHADRYGIHLLNTILGGGLSSRLYRKLREEHGLVYSIHSEYHAYLDAGMLVVSGSTMPEGLERTIHLVSEEVTGPVVTSPGPPRLRKSGRHSSIRSASIILIRRIPIPG